VLAAAVAGRADILVTENLKDFPPAALAHLGLTVAGQDDFLSGLLERTRTRCLTRSAGRPPATAANPEQSWRCSTSWQAQAKAVPGSPASAAPCCNPRRDRSDAGL